ncbi:hypothetical protein Asp14428_12120 [Actinoplanes sp. NBRC 14428]|nr:hypothetical protein Asp14428_12120 [Actinoplanes sp. NBRC 14428]
MIGAIEAPGIVSARHAGIGVIGALMVDLTALVRARNVNQGTKFRFAVMLASAEPVALAPDRP